MNTISLGPGRVSLTKKKVGRPRNVVKLVQFGCKLPPELIKKVRQFKAHTGAKLNDIIAESVTNYLDPTGKGSVIKAQIHKPRVKRKQVSFFRDDESPF